jgi:hypothetical protein
MTGYPLMPDRPTESTREVIRSPSFSFIFLSYNTDRKNTSAAVQKQHRIPAESAFISICIKFCKKLAQINTNFFLLLMRECRGGGGFPAFSGLRSNGQKFAARYMAQFQDFRCSFRFSDLQIRTLVLEWRCFERNTFRRYLFWHVNSRRWTATPPPPMSATPLRK